MEKKRLFFIVFGFFILCSLFGFANAEIQLSEIKDLYNLGDRVYLDITIIPQNIEGKFDINLFCDGKSVNLERMSAEARFVLSEKVVYSTFIRLTPDYIGSLKGNCNIQVSLGTDSISSRNFIISDKILASTGFDKVIYNPGDLVIVTLEAKKENGDKLNGFFKSSGILNVEKPIADGKLLEKLTLPQNLASGDYKIDMFIYDKLRSNILNSVNASAYLSVSSVPKSIKIALSKTDLKPGDNQTIALDLVDQADKKTSGAINLKLISPDKKEITKTIQSGESIIFNFPDNALYGIWQVKASFSDIKEKANFNVKKLGKLIFEFAGNVLIVKNTGNSVYDNHINVTIGSEVREIYIKNLDAGEERKFSLEAPNGEYIVKVGDENNNFEGAMLLTGAAIGINNFNGSSLFNKYPFVWTFLIIILLLFAGTFVLRLKKTPFKLIGSMIERKKRHKKSSFGSTIQVNDNFSLKTSRKVTEAEHSLVLNGSKQSSSVISLKIDKFNTLDNNTKNEIKNIISLSESRKGAIEKSGDYFLIFFNPLVTKSFSNEGDASEIAFDIYKRLSDLSRKISNKLNFGIGLNNGDVISNIESGRLKYTSIGNIVLLAKKISDLGGNKLYASEDFRKKLLKDLRVEKVSLIGNIQVYSILHVANRQANADKLEDLLKRMHN